MLPATTSERLFGEITTLLIVPCPNESILFRLLTVFVSIIVRVGVYSGVMFRVAKGVVVGGGV
jgi:hypothetical protein